MMNAFSSYHFTCSDDVDRYMGDVTLSEWWCEPSGRPRLVGLGLMACQYVRLVNSVNITNSHKKYKVTDFHNSKQLVE